MCTQRPSANLWLCVLFVLQCGNFAVLVDLHVLPLGSQKDASWFTVAHVEVGAEDVNVKAFGRISLCH